MMLVSSSQATMAQGSPGKSLLIDASLRSLNYVPVTSFEPICLLTNNPQLLVVHGSSTFRSLADFLAAARVRPGALSLAAAGPATANHIEAETLKRAAQVNL